MVAGLGHVGEGQAAFVHLLDVLRLPALVCFQHLGFSFRMMTVNCEEGLAGSVSHMRTRAFSLSSSVSPLSLKKTSYSISIIFPHFELCLTR